MKNKLKKFVKNNKSFLILTAMSATAGAAAGMYVGTRKTTHALSWESAKFQTDGQGGKRIEVLHTNGTNSYLYYDPQAA